MINIRDKRFEFYDALPSGHHDFENDVLKNLRQWLSDESLDKRKESLDLEGWVDHAPTHIPHQRNGHDCGMFAVKYAQCAALDLNMEDLPFGQQHVEMFRKRAVLEMMDGKLCM